MMKKSHVVTILNQKLVVRSEAGDEAVAEVTEMVASKIQEILEASKSASVLTASLLTCLNFAEELRERKAGREASRFRAAQKVKDIIQLIDTQLSGEKRSVL